MPGVRAPMTLARRRSSRKRSSQQPAGTASAGHHGIRRCAVDLQGQVRHTAGESSRSPRQVDRLLRMPPRGVLIGSQGSLPAAARQIGRGARARGLRRCECEVPPRGQLAPHTRSFAVRHRSQARKYIPSDFRLVELFGCVRRGHPAGDPPVRHLGRSQRGARRCCSAGTHWGASTLHGTMTALPAPLTSWWRWRASCGTRPRRAPGPRESLSTTSERAAGWAGHAALGATPRASHDQARVCCGGGAQGGAGPRAQARRAPFTPGRLPRGGPSRRGQQQQRRAARQQQQRIRRGRPATGSQAVLVAPAPSPQRCGTTPPPFSRWPSKRTTHTPRSPPRDLRVAAGRPVTYAPGSPLLEVSHAAPLARAKAPLPVCTMQLPDARAPGAFAGPRIRLPLPSFSGGTPECPQLLKYACDLWTHVRPVAPAFVTVPRALPAGALPASAAGRQEASSSDAAGGELLAAVLGGRPLLALAFDDMEVRRGAVALSFPTWGSHLWRAGDIVVASLARCADDGAGAGAAAAGGHRHAARVGHVVCRQREAVRRES